MNKPLGISDTQPLGILYRPRTFAAMLGNPRIASSTFPSSLTSLTLIAGDSGSGKTTLARLIAAYFSGKKAGVAPKGVIEINAANTGKEDIVDLLSIISSRPMFSDYHIVIMDEAHALTPASVNALLKPLESETEFVKWIFCTDQPHKLPDRVKSRFNKIFLKAPSEQELVDYLLSVAEREKLNIEEKQIIRLVRVLGTSNIREALNSLQDIAGGKSVDAAITTQFQGAENNSYELLVDALKMRQVVVDVMAVYKFWTDLLIAELTQRTKAGVLQPIAFNYFQKRFSVDTKGIDTKFLIRILANLNKARTAVIVGGVSGEAAWIQHTMSTT